MKQQRVIAVLSIAIFFLFMRVQEEGKKEIVDLAQFTEYYEHSLAGNGGFELTDSFYTFEKTYNFPSEYIDISKVKTEEPPKQEEGKKKPVKKVYTIQKGDTLSKIASKNGTSVESIMANNPKMNKNLVVGTTLDIVSEDGVFYKLQKGDSVSRIAVKYKVKTADILQYNDINPKKMRIGEEIFLKSPDYKAFLEKEKPKLTPKELDKKLREKQEQEMYAQNKKTGKTVTQAPTPDTEPQPAPSGGGNFAMPVRYAGVSSPYGNRFHPVLRRYVLHTGVDLIAKYVPLRAAKAGVVSFAGNMSGYGKIIIIKHDDGFETRYAHLSQISTRAGERVEKGELIGKTGNSGRTTGPHLHFEIRKGGRTLNPMKYL